MRFYFKKIKQGVCDMIQTNVYLENVMEKEVVTN